MGAVENGQTVAQRWIILRVQSIKSSLPSSRWKFTFGNNGTVARRLIGSFRSNCDPPSSNGTPTVSLDNQNRLDFNTGGLFVPERASKSKPIGIRKEEGVLTHEFIPMKNVVRQRGINFGEFTSSRIPLSTSRSPLSSPHRFATRHNRTRFAPLLFAPYSSKAYKYFSEQKSTKERGRRNRFCPGEMKNGQLANARSPTVTNRTRGRKHCALLGKFLEENLENARMCAPPIPPLLANRRWRKIGKVSNRIRELANCYQILWISSLPSPHLSLFSHRQIDPRVYIRIIHPVAFRA